MKTRKLLVLEANIDDMNPQWFEPLMDKLLQAGALDVVLIPSIMKKSRPAVILQVLAEPRRKQKLLTLIFEESTTLGIRSYPLTRYELKRETRKVKTPYGEVVVKIGRDEKGRLVNMSPEHEACRVLAEKKGIPLKKIHQTVLASLREK